MRPYQKSYWKTTAISAVSTGSLASCAWALFLYRTPIAALEYPLNVLASDLCFWPIQLLVMALSIVSLCITVGGVLCIYGDKTGKGF